MVSEKEPLTVDTLITFYKNVLHSLDLVVEDSGVVSKQHDDKKQFLTVEDKRLVVPVQDILKNGADWNTVVAFHPLSENVYNGESEVIKKTKTLVCYRLVSTLCLLIRSLTVIAANKDLHCKLTPKQSALLEVLPNANEKTVNYFDRLIKATSITGKHKMVGIYLKRGGQYKGKIWGKVAVVNFPIMDSWEDGEESKSIFGIKSSNVVNYKGFKALFDFIIPNNRDPDYYSYGSNNQTAPYFHSLLSAYVKLATQLNNITLLFKEHIDEANEILIPLKWAKDLNRIDQFQDLIPDLEGNEGPIGGVDKEQEDTQSDGDDYIVNVEDDQSPPPLQQKPAVQFDVNESTSQKRSVQSAQPQTTSTQSGNPFMGQTAQVSNTTQAPQRDSDGVEIADLINKRSEQDRTSGIVSEYSFPQQIQPQMMRGHNVDPRLYNHMPMHDHRAQAYGVDPRMMQQSFQPTMNPYYQQQAHFHPSQQGVGMQPYYPENNLGIPNLRSQPAYNQNPHHQQTTHIPIIKRGF